MRCALVLAALPLVLAACGGGGGSGLPPSSTHAATPLAFVQASAKKTAAATSEHLDMVVSASVQGQKV
jgi:predicted small lipoprotein YifL